jgi:hypothetical protein
MAAGPTGISSDALSASAFALRVHVSLSPVDESSDSLSLCIHTRVSRSMMNVTHSEPKLESKMTSSTLERERDKTAGAATISGSLDPVGTGLGAAAGGVAADALFGTVGREGMVAGAVAGNTIAESIDPAAEEAYWRENYSSRPYVTGEATFNEYRPAYSYGVDAHRRYEGQSFEQAEPELMRDWDRVKGMSSLTWENAKHAVRDSWQRVSDLVERATPGDSDHDRK